MGDIELTGDDFMEYFANDAEEGEQIGGETLLFSQIQNIKKGIDLSN